jgi:hypothetical protein
MPNYPLLDRVGIQHGFKENMRSIPTSQSSNIKQKKQWWFHKLNAWEDYKLQEILNLQRLGSTFKEQF